MGVHCSPPVGDPMRTAGSSLASDARKRQIVTPTNASPMSPVFAAGWALGAGTGFWLFGADSSPEGAPASFAVGRFATNVVFHSIRVCSSSVSEDGCCAHDRKPARATMRMNKTSDPWKLENLGGVLISFPLNDVLNEP